MRKRILILAEYYLPGYRAGGPIRSLSNLIDALPEAYEWHVLTRDRDMLDTDPYDSVQIDQWVTVGSARVCYASPAGLGPVGLWRRLCQVRPDLLYMNSFFSPHFSLLPTLEMWMKLLPRAAILVAPRGEFSPGALAIKPWRKKAALATSRLLGLHSNVGWHASTGDEADDIRRALGPHVGTIHVARNLGATLASFDDAPAESLALSRLGPPRPLKVCFLSRISRTKNLDYALKVLSTVKEAVKFTIYGPREDPNYWAECQALLVTLPSHVSVEVAGPIPHHQVHCQLSQHDLFFLPTRGENYGHVFAEALSAGLAVLTSDQTPWRGLAELGLGNDLPLSDPSAFARVIDVMANETAEHRAARRQRCMAHARSESQDYGALQAHRNMFEAALGLEPRKS